MMVWRNRSCAAHQQNQGTHLNLTSALVAGLSLAFVPVMAAHAAGPADAPAAASESTEPKAGLDEIVITARRKSELLQDVPQTVNAVTAAELQNFNLLDLKDLSQVVPGLQVIPQGNRSLDSNSFRGITFQPTSGSQNTLGFYINDTFVTNNFVTTSLFDISQIEVLSGPQGTLRGEPSPSGSLTITTHKPDLEHFGGYVTATAMTYGQTNGNGAVNLPIIQDKLAVRLAGLADADDLDGVDSVNSPAHPYSHTYAGRISVRYEPIDSIETNLMYENFYWQQAQFQQVEGLGAPGGFPNAPAGYNGPPLSPQDLRGVGGAPDIQWNHSEIFTGSLDWHVLGQKVSYNGSYWTYADNNGNGALAPNANQIPGLTIDNNIPRLPFQFDTPSIVQHVQTQELRFSSETPIWGLMDYTAGAFFKHTNNQVEVAQVASFLPGSFGSILSPTGPDPFFYDPKYTLQLQINSPSNEKEYSGFANLTFHLPKETELTVGGRYIDYKKTGFTEGTLLPNGVFAALPPAALGLPPATPCSALGAGSTYPGTCDIPASILLQGNTTALARVPQNLDSIAWIYNISLSHKINQDLLVYTTVSSSWRPPSIAVGVNNAANDPLLNSLITLKPETSTDYEAGFKWTFLENRARLNVSYFHQKFENFIYSGIPITYLSDNGAATNPTQFTFTTNEDAVINGVDMDVGFRITPYWTFDLNATYTNGHLTNSEVPCNPPGGTFPGPPYAGPPYIYTCNSNVSTSVAPNFNSSAQSEYRVPLRPQLEGFVRGLYSYYGRNSHVDQLYVAPSYGILNVFLGLRSPNGAWEAAIFAKNALNAKPELFSSVGGPAIDASSVSQQFGTTSGYYNTGIAPRQELGITFTYAFGSR